MDLIKSYEQEYTRNYASCNKKIASFDTAINQKNLLTDIKHDFAQAENCLRNIEKEILNLEPQQAKLFAARIKKFQENLVIARKNIGDIEFKEKRIDLLGKKEDTREKLLTNNEVLQESGEKLDNIYKIATKTQEIGYKSMGNLKKQRITIHNISDKVNDVGTNLGMANRTVTEMNSRRLWMKFMMYGIIILLIAAICVVLYIKIVG